MQESFDELKQNGDNNFKNNDYDIAIMFYSKALQLDENEKTHLVYLNRCLSYIKLSHYEEALEDAIKASQMKPDNAKAWSRVGSCLLGLNRNEEANIAFDRAVQLDPSNEDYKKLITPKINDEIKKSEETIEKEDNTEKEDNSEKEDNMESMMKKLKNMKSNMNSLPIENLMGPLFNKMMSNKKLMDLASDSSFQSQMLQYQSNPLEAMKNPKILDLVGDVLKELDLSKTN
jgi:stress-induced-phosphoprotein 1